MVQRLLYAFNMNARCPFCLLSTEITSGSRKGIRTRSFYRKSDGQKIARFCCSSCRKNFSRATLDPRYRQNKRHLNYQIFKLLCSGISMRRLAIVMNVSRTTIARKLVYLGKRSRVKLQADQQRRPEVKSIQFDDIETFEHPRAKPLSIFLVVESGTRRILCFDVAEMPSKGSLGTRAELKYGKRFDTRSRIRTGVLGSLKESVETEVVVKSNKNPHYQSTVRKIFPAATHERFMSQRARSTGYGELKKGGFDPLFSVNHTGVSLRDSIKRLSRKTWCTTKKKERLLDALALYAVLDNQILLK